MRISCGLWSSHTRHKELSPQLCGCGWLQRGSRDVFYRSRLREMMPLRSSFWLNHSAVVFGYFLDIALTLLTGQTNQRPGRSGL
ncbi:hypothetical protein RRG08_046225 [Elysia crispata]|uniref:Uncharacterized protein n=1 Tax=Elysia crispata TaxID=231223 RepID=A0AAE1D1T0_9GAST|nr:hypothetical protein RRG08_046225 [Elysia crispata]